MYFRARYYDPQTGEFISRDPLEYVDGMSLYRGYFVPNGMDPNGMNDIAVVWGTALAEPSPIGEAAAGVYTVARVTSMVAALIGVGDIVRRCFCHQRHPHYQQCRWLDQTKTPISALKSSMRKVAGWSGPHIQKIRELGAAKKCPGGSKGVRFAAEVLYYYQDPVSRKFITYTVDFPVNCCACCNRFLTGVSCRQIHPDKGSGGVPLPPPR